MIKSNTITNTQNFHSIENIKNPVVIVPGFMESTLTTELKYKIWPATLPFSLGKLSIEKKLIASSLVHENYFNLLKFLRTIGYKDNKTFFSFSYDWRQTVEKIGNQLYEFLKNLQSTHGFESVDIINHSMGGLVTRQAYKLGAKISKVTYIVSPHYGMHTAYLMTNPSMLEQYVTLWLKKSLGSSMKLKLVGLYTAGTTKLAKKVESIVSNFPSSYDLLPDKFYFQNQPLVNNIETLEETYFGDNDNVGPWNYPEPQHEEIKRSMRFKEHLGKDLPGRQNLVIYSQSEITKDKILWDNDSQTKAVLVESDAKGDDTIGKKSQMLEGGNPNGTRAEVSGIHSEVQNSNQTHNLIYNFLKSA